VKEDDMSAPQDARDALVRDAVADIRAIEAAEGVTPDSLAKIKQRLIALAEHGDLFNADAYPRPEPGDPRQSCLYRLSEDDDHRFALYLNMARPGTDSPVHDHTTWAVIVGIEGEEVNRMYDRTPDDGVKQTGEAVVKRGTGVAFGPDDLHSIHIDGAEGAVNFHMYGLGLEQLHGRRYYKPAEHVWKVFPAHSDIREARPGR
jgi:predicted metal-dependent enzyme (double-stranded beta helix superfamily)